MIPFLFALAAGLSDLIVGALTLRGTTAQLQSRYVIAFGAGVLLAATFFDMLPEVEIKTDAAFVAAGFVAFYLLEKVVMLHACGEDECEAHHIGTSGVIGMALDNVVDGASIAVGYLINPVLGFIITLAVVLHEIPQGITSAVITLALAFPPGQVCARRIGRMRARLQCLDSRARSIRLARCWRD